MALWWCNHIKYDQLSPSSFRTLKDILEHYIIPKEKIVIDEALVPEEYPEGTPGNRVLELTETALTALKYIKEERYMGTDGYILAAVSGGATINTVYKATFRSILKRAGILPSGIMILSNTFVMRQLRAGIDPKYLSIWMGYASVQSFQKAYATLIKAWESESEIPKSICNI